MARWSRDIIVTEKIDGTNAQVFITQAGAVELAREAEGWSHEKMGIVAMADGLVMRAGSRTQWITAGKTTDNYGFAAWCAANAAELFKLGEGRHFGEWWGSGIQRKYGIANKRFSLFNVSRWYDTHQDGNYSSEPAELIAAPACCHVVPVLIRGPNRHDAIDITLRLLQGRGSYAAPGFMDPEGIIVWHTAANIGFKKTIKRDEVPKSVADRMAA